ncbi:hypothetical protein ISS03_04285 [Patescibacteria group bacterium]|nr:hypothetical protein [Patescibacteria group bacterium]
MAPKEHIEVEERDPAKNGIVLGHITVRTREEGERLASAKNAQRESPSDIYFFVKVRTE